jgi:hypothetical protein
MTAVSSIWWMRGLRLGVGTIPHAMAGMVDPGITTPTASSAGTRRCSMSLTRGLTRSQDEFVRV